MSDRNPYFYRGCRVERIIDGDTVDLFVHVGFDTYLKRRVRLWGIDTPEVRTRDLDEKAQGIAATERLAQLIEEGNTSSVLVVDLESHELDKYGRVLGTIWCGGKNLNRVLLDEGHAKPYPLD
jgi:micrococcal nuclease